MKFLFTAPRFHTNQVSIVQGLTEKGHQVRYFVVFKGKVEDYSFCQPLVLKPSESFQKKWKRYKKKYTDSEVESIAGGQFVPDYNELKKAFLDYDPDVVICRERTNLTACVYKLCAENNIPCVLYDQEPYLKQKTADKKIRPGKEKNLFGRLMLKINRLLDKDFQFIKNIKETIGFPNVRMTPVMVSDASADTDKCVPAENSYFIPLVSKINNISDRTYSENGTVRLLCVSKYREYKNLPLLIDAINLIKERNDFKLTVLGQAKSKDEIEYKNNLQNKINAYGLENKVTLAENVPYSKMNDVYLNHDVFLLVSKRETYGMAVVEAMSFGLPCIMSYNAGIAYSVKMSNGIIIDYNNANDISEAILYYLSNKKLLENFGKLSYEYIKKNQLFENYYSEIKKMLSIEFDLNLE